MKYVGSLAIVSLALFACDGGGTPPSRDSAAATGKPATTAAKPGGATTAAAAKPKAKGPFPASTHEAMKDPTKATEEAPATYEAKFDTTAGEFVLKCTREWAPAGADRFYNLVKIGFFDDVSFFRAVKGFVVQFGIHGDPEVSKAWRKANIEPDEVKGSNKKGYLTYAQAGRPAAEGKTAASRSTQLFINLKDNPRLDGMGFAPVCEVSKGLDVVEKLHTGYGERAGRDQGNINMKGNVYLREKYPLLDYIKTARLVEGSEGGEGGGDAKGEGGGDASKDDAKGDDAKKDAKDDAKKGDAKDAKGDAKKADAKKDDAKKADAKKDDAKK